MNYSAFQNGSSIAQGTITEVVTISKNTLKNGGEISPLIFNDTTGEQLDVDLQGPLHLILKTLPKPETIEGTEKEEKIPTSVAKKGRPKLGVVSKEVTLLPRHWEWLKQQKGGASATLRTLVEAAKRKSTNQDKIRLAQEACNRFIMAIAGDLPNFEEATRTLFAADFTAFAKTIATWPQDIQDFALKLLKPATNSK